MLLKLKNERGQALAEMALVLPVLILLIFGIIEFGRVYHTYLTVTNAAREGARAGAVGAGEDEVKQVVKESSFTLDSDLMTVEVTLTGRGDPVKVEATYPLDIYTPIFSNILGDTLTIRGTAVMRVE